MTLPHDYARCRGFGKGPEDWLDECHTCQRRTAAGGEMFMKPPSIITFVCEFFIPGGFDD
jgi:hypothetical protein